MLVDQHQAMIVMDATYRRASIMVIPSRKSLLPTGTGTIILMLAALLI